MESKNPGDIQRAQELYRMLDEIEVPEETLSDLSSELVSRRSELDFDRRSFTNPHYSPGQEFFEQSGNSGSGWAHFEESRVESERSQRSHSFTPKQVSTMMNWSKTHITAAEGLFPQVSAPSMSLEEEPVSQEGLRRAQTSFDRRSSKFPVVDLPTHEKLSQEVVTFSPSQQESNWYFKPKAKHSQSSACSDLVAQGSALLAGQFPSEKSLLQVRESAAVYGEMSKLNNELAMAKVSLRKEQEMHEMTKREVMENACYLQELEAERAEREEKLTELQEQVSLMQARLKSPESLDQLRGKSLEYARIELKQLKAYLGERDKKLEDMRHALAQKNAVDSSTAREREIEELTLELSKLKILNSALTKKADEHVEKAGKLFEAKKQLESELKYFKENQDFSVKQYEESLKQKNNELREKIKELSKITQEKDSLSQQLTQLAHFKDADSEELANAKRMIEELHEQVAQVNVGRPITADYDAHIKKIKQEGEQEREKAQKEIEALRKTNGKLQTQVQSLEGQMQMFLSGKKNPEALLSSEGAEYMKLMEVELNSLQQQLSEFIQKEKEWKETQDALNEQVTDAAQWKEQAVNLDISLMEAHKRITQLENSLQSAELEIENKNNELSQKAEIEKSLQMLENERNIEKQKLLHKYQDENYTHKTESYLRKSDSFSQKSDTYSQSNENYMQKSEDYGRKTDRFVKKIGSFQKVENEQRTETKNWEKEAMQEQYQTEIKRLQQSLNNVQEALGEQNQLLKEDLEEKEEEVQSLKKKIKEAQDSEKDLKQFYEGRINNLKAKFDEELNKIKVRNERNAEVQTEDTHELEEALEKERNAIEEKYKSSLQGLSNEYLAKTNDIEKQFQANEKNYQDQIKSFKEQIKECKELIAQHEESNQSHRNEIENCQIESSKQVEALNLRLQEDKKQIDALTQELTGKENELTRLTETISEISGNLTITQEKSEEEKEAVKQLYQAQIASLSEEKEALMSTLDFLEKEKEQLKSSLEMTEEALQTQHDLLQTKDKEITEMSSQLDTEREKFEDTAKTQQSILADKEQTLKHEIRLRDEELRAEKAKIREELVQENKEKINTLKQEHLRQKREWERERKRLKELAENATDNAKKEVEIHELEKLNQERKEWDRKHKQKVKLIQHKQSKELQDRELTLRLEFDKEKTEALRTQAEAQRARHKQDKEQLQKYYEELQESYLEEHAQRIELKIRRELQETHMKAINDLETEHIQEKEQILKKIEEKKANDRLATSLEDLRTSQIQEINREKAEQAARAQEFKNVFSFLEEELRALKSGKPSRKQTYPQLGELLNTQIEEIVNSTKRLYENKLNEQTKLINKMSTLEKQKTERPSPVEEVDRHCIKFKGHLYLIIDQVVEDLHLLHDTFGTEGYSDPVFPVTSKQEYTTSVTSLRKTAMRRFSQSISKESEEDLKTENSELRQKYSNMEEDLRELTIEYKNYMLRTKEWVENSNAEKDVWRTEKASLQDTIARLRKSIQELEESTGVSPEMLSPDETYKLIMGIFKRSNREDIVFQLLQRNPEFLGILQDFLDIATEATDSKLSLPFTDYSGRPSRPRLSFSSQKLKKQYFTSTPKSAGRYIPRDFEQTF